MTSVTTVQLWQTAVCGTTVCGRRLVVADYCLRQTTGCGATVCCTIVHHRISGWCSNISRWAIARSAGQHWSAPGQCEAFCAVLCARCAARLPPGHCDVCRCCADVVASSAARTVQAPGDAIVRATCQGYLSGLIVGANCQASCGACGRGRHSRAWGC